MKTLFISLLLASMTTGAQQTTKQVYTSPNGKKYHTHKDCQYLARTKEVKTISLKQAQDEGKTICSRCESKDNKNDKK